MDKKDPRALRGTSSSWTPDLRRAARRLQASASAEEDALLRSLDNYGRAAAALVSEDVSFRVRQLRKAVIPPGFGLLDATQSSLDREQHRLAISWLLSGQGSEEMSRALLEALHQHAGCEPPEGLPSQLAPARERDAWGSLDLFAYFDRGSPSGLLLALARDDQEARDVEARLDHHARKVESRFGEDFSARSPHIFLTTRGAPPRRAWESASRWTPMSWAGFFDVLKHAAQRLPGESRGPLLHYGAVIQRSILRDPRVLSEAIRWLGENRGLPADDPEWIRLHPTLCGFYAALHTHYPRSRS